MAKVLVVDDEPGLLLALKGILTREGHDVVAVDSGEKALEEMSAHEFDLALIDLQLKGIGGLEVLAELHAKCPGTVAIILTAHATLETAVTALRHGAHDYLFKPCQTVELRESVRTGLLKRQEMYSSSPAGESLLAGVEDAPPAETAVSTARFLQRAGLVVDVARHLVILDGKLLELSPTEFAIVSYLASELPRVVTAQELVREIQGHASEPWEARETIRFHIHRIRHKARATAGRGDLVRTVRGVGYTLNL